MGGFINGWLDVWKGLFDTQKAMFGRSDKNEFVFFWMIQVPLY